MDSLPVDGPLCYLYHILIWFHVITPVVNKHAPFDMHFPGKDNYIYIYIYIYLFIWRIVIFLSAVPSSIILLLLYNGSCFSTTYRVRWDTKNLPLSAHFSGSCHQKPRETHTHTHTHTNTHCKNIQNKWGKSEPAS